MALPPSKPTIGQKFRETDFEVVSRDTAIERPGTRNSRGHNSRRFVSEGITEGTKDSGDDTLFLKSKVEVNSAYTSQDLGYIKLIAEHRYKDVLSLTPGKTYKLSFDMYCLVPWQFFVSDTANADILPGVLVYSPTAGDGSSKDAVLMSGGEWVSSNEPVSGNEVAPFVNIIDNGDFHDVSNTGMEVDEADGLAEGETQLTVKTTNATTANSLNKIFLSEGENVPGSNYNDTIGLCTAVDSTTSIDFEARRSSSATGSQIAAGNSDNLYTLDGWKINGTTLWPNYLSTNMTHSADNYAKGMIHLDGGRNGTSVLKLSSHKDVYTNPTEGGGTYLYQEVDLDGNCWYDLHFKYAQTNVASVDSALGAYDENAVTARLAYDVYDTVDEAGHNKSLTGGWSIADVNGLASDIAIEGTNGADSGTGVNFSFCGQNSFYSHPGQYYDHMTDSVKFRYVRFFVPPRSTEANAVTTSIRFSMIIPEFNQTLEDDNHSIFLSYVCVKKSFPDLVEFTTGKNKLCPVRALSKKDGIEYNPFKWYDRWQSYDLEFTVPSDYSNTNDWEIRFYGGAFGTTKNTKSAKITAVSLSSTTATYTAASHGFSALDKVTISGTTNFNDADLANNTIQSVAGDGNSFTMTVSSGGASNESSLTANAELVNSSNYPNAQAVGIKNVRMMTNDYKSGEEYSDHLLILPDNKTERTSFTMYHTNNNYWDTAFYSNSSFNFSPVYSYVNGLLQISNSDFTDETNLIRWFYLDRTIHDNENYKQFVLTDNVFPPLGGIELTQETNPSTSAYTIDALRILGHTFASFEFWPKDDGTGFQSAQETNNSEGNEPWHYKWFHHNQPYVDSNYSYISEYVANIPIKYIPESTNNVWTDNGNQTKGKYHRHSLSSSSNWEDGNGAASLCWRPGGSPGDANVVDVPEWASTNCQDHILNDVLFFPIMGTNGIVQDLSYENEDIFGAANKDMQSSIVSQLGYTEAGEDGLFISSLNIKLHLFGQLTENIIHYLGDGAYDHTNTTKDRCWIPKIKISVHKMQFAGYEIDAPIITNDDLLNLVVGVEGQSSYTLENNYSSAIFPEVDDNRKLSWVGNAIPGTYISDVGPGATMSETSINPEKDYNQFRIDYDYVLSFDSGNGNNPSHVKSTDNIILKVEILGKDGNALGENLHGGLYNVHQRIGLNSLGYGLVYNDLPDGPSLETRQEYDWTTNLGLRFSKLDVNFYEPDVTAGDTFGHGMDSNGIKINFNFRSVEDAITDSWLARKFTVGFSTVNHFNEESPIYITDTVLGDGQNSDGDSVTIQPSQAPDVTVAVGVDIIQNPLHRELKIYLKDEEQDIWYKQLTVDTEHVKIKSSTSGKEFEMVMEGSNHYVFEVKADDMLYYNEVDSYDSESLISQEDAKLLETMTCKYKTSVQINNRLYVGNVYQNGKHYGDRMIKTPIGKYNLFPASNYIDVAIIDGDEITGLAYFKDKLLQFKKRKVFAINVAGDYEYLEDTFDHIGVNKQCQIVTTPYGICWANSNGCFLYDGESVENLIDDKIGTESFQTSGIAGIDNYWSILSSYSPSIGYIKSTKKLIVNKNTGYSNTAETLSHDSAAIEGFTYDFQSKGWTLLMNKITGIEETSKPAKTGLLSNFVNNQDGDVLYYSVSASADGGTQLNSIYKWDDSSRTSSDASNNEDFFYLTTKDFDFGSPGVRKKIYKVYVTFKSKQGDLAAHSNVKAYFATNGSSLVTEFDNSSTNYSTTNGFSDGASSTQWLIAELKPSNSINNVYSFQLQFKAIAANVANKFEINDITIVYREKTVR